jgi:uncharacterized membrane protein (UPF0127 family)
MNSFSRFSSGLRGWLSARRDTPRDRYMRVLNRTRNTELASRMEVADNPAKRNQGLLGRQRLSSGEGLWIIPCEAVHTFWMRFPIDLVYLDRGRQIRKLVCVVHPWRISACLSAHSVLELPAGTIRNTLTQPGDTLEFTDLPLTADSSSA